MRADGAAFRGIDMSDSNEDTGTPLAWADDYLMSRRQAGAFALAHGIHLAVSTLAKLVGKPHGPPIERFGRRVYHRVGAFRAWLHSRLS